LSGGAEASVLAAGHLAVGRLAVRDWLLLVVPYRWLGAGLLPSLQGVMALALAGQLFGVMSDDATAALAG